MFSHKVAAIIVQYNNWQDTLVCLESVLQSRCLPRWIIVVDNASSNDAVAKIVRWAAGEETPSCPICPDLLPRPVKKPYPLWRASLEEALASPHPDVEEQGRPRILLVQNTANAGYSGGNNVGLRIGLAAGADAFWLLNNDTVVDPGACGALCERLFACKRPGLAGGLICYLAAPDVVQCQAGGHTNPWFFLSTMTGQAVPVAKALQTSPQEVEKDLNFIYGASVMVSRAFVDTVGLMDERLFLYCEEQDWSWSARGRFDLAYAPKALIYHKEGGSTGMSRLQRPLRRLCLLARNKVLVTWKHKAIALPSVCVGIAFASLRLLLRRLTRTDNAG